MTRQRKIVTSPLADGNNAMLQPLRPVRNLTAEVVQRIQSEIASGRLKPGSRLPTELGMVAALGVSRTVVREAVAALRAEGLVTTRQGSGAFVTAEPVRRGFRIDPDGLASIGAVLHVLELRQAIEVEAAALASARAPARALGVIACALKAFRAAVRNGESAVAEDFAFHSSIAAAAMNPHFSGLLAFLGHVIIPRQTIRADGMAAVDHAVYLQQILIEHERIYAAIAAHDASAAREAMRTHLSNAGDRYRGLARAPAGKRARATAAVAV
jgi:GntR family transcriptional regulator, transcriptional repressor for pyruvate dehydrogenase complex